MNKFAELLDRLAYEPSRNNKLRLIADYLRSTPDPERGYALAALTGALSFQHAKAGILRDAYSCQSRTVNDESSAARLRGIHLAILLPFVSLAVLFCGRSVQSSSLLVSNVGRGKGIHATLFYCN